MKKGQMTCEKHQDQAILQDQKSGHLYCPVCRAEKKSAMFHSSANAFASIARQEIKAARGNQ